ncbi:unnamed protein product [Aphanomyces euteiches]|nr:hypothetical protein LEN26_013319 [Aphanomyces euteiches]KAH9116481.1 hypothetical protein AeMF1_009572 [Aphanomyces euteiches]KAH9133150.1 hypothetical protein AeRB84_020704 [Aphanomyces euteiches]KAH9194684.1 hypothetical protein AeNC1_003324 [Aphanomyces euteiches]
MSLLTLQFALNATTMVYKVTSLTPIQASLVAVGEASKDETVFIVHVVQGHRSWYTAHDFVEFEALADQIGHIVACDYAMCDTCHLARDIQLDCFHQKPWLPQTRKRRAVNRFTLVQDFLRALLVTTQGLLCDPDDVCSVTTAIRRFLQVDAAQPNHSSLTSLAQLKLFKQEALLMDAYPIYAPLKAGRSPSDRLSTASTTWID